MKRALRRHYMALINQKIQREVEEINEYFSRPARWGRDNPERRETRRKAAIRHAHRNDGRYVRTKEASGRSYICHCEWCLSNWTFASQKEIARINDEEQDYLNMGCPPDWGYSWADLWGYYDDTYWDEDWSWDWWCEYEQLHELEDCYCWGGRRNKRCPRHLDTGATIGERLYRQWKLGSDKILY